MKIDNKKIIKLFLIDDSTSVIKLIEAMLSESQYDIFKLKSVNTLADAFNILKNNSFDIILLDLNLPDSEGMDTLLKIKEKHPSLPIIIITGGYKVDLGIKAISLGAQDYLIKNKIDLYILTKSIHYAIERKQVEIAFNKKATILSERVKDLNCLYSISRLSSLPDISLPELIQRSVNLIPQAFQYPEITRCRVVFNEKTYVSEPFVPTRWKLMADIAIDGKLFGILEVYYIEERPEQEQGPFLIEERNLVNGITNILGSAVKRGESERGLALRNQIAEIFLTVSDDVMFSKVLQVILEYMDSKYGIFGYINESGALVCPSMTKNTLVQFQIPDKEIIFPKKEWNDIWGRAIKEKRPLYSNKPSNSNMPVIQVPVIRAMDVPLIHKGAVIGNLLVINKETDYTDKDQNFLVAIAEYITPVLVARLQRASEEKMRKQMEEALIELNQIFNIFLSSVPIIVSRIDGNNIVTLSRGSGLKKFGLKENQLVGTNIFEKYPQIKNKINYIKEKGVKDQFIQEVTDEGKTFYLQNYFFPSKEIGKAITAISIDITDIVLVKNKIKQSAEKIKTIFESITDGIMVTDLSGNIVEANESLIRILRLNNKKELIGVNSINYISSIDKERLGENIKKILEGDHAFVDEYLLATDDEKEIHTEINSSLLKDGSGSPIGFISVIRDISERKKIEEQITIFRKFAETSEQGMGMSDLEGNVSYANPTLVRLMGDNKPADVYKKNISCYYSKEDFIKLENEILPIVFKKGYKTVEIPLQSIDGKIIPAIQSINIIKNEKGEPFCIANWITDISERKKIEDQKILFEKELQHSMKLKSIGTLASGIAHEINTPMQYIGDNTLFFSEGVVNLLELINSLNKNLVECTNINKSCDMKEVIDKAFKEADLEYLREEIPSAISQSLLGINQVKKIISAMKDFSYLDSDQKQMADINKSIESTIMISRNEWKEIANIETELDSSLPQIPCFIGEINQVFMNIIVNAAHAISDITGDENQNKGTIKICSHSRAKSISITISDTGTGIPEKIRNRIFDPFFTTKEIGRGTGQGLSIAYDIIVNKHNGKIKVDSRVGIGTTLQITLPITDKCKH